MPDPFQGFSSLTSQGESWAAVAPSDAVDFPNRPKAIYCGGTGNIAAVGTDGVVATFAVTAGQFLDIRPVRINLTGTSAANIVAIY